jgi:hypothetical protein
VLAFRRDVLNGRVVSPNHAGAQAWLRGNRQHHERLTGLARSLADAHSWTPNDALVFVLTNETPARPPIRVQVQSKMGSNSPLRITVEAESWMPPAQVARAFRDVRDRMKLRTAGDQSRRARAVSPRAVALVAFVEATPGSWRKRLAAWNTASRRGRFTDRANFRRSYVAARRRLDVATFGELVVTVTRKDALPQPVSVVSR